jgi:DNA topoisomerase-2
MSKTKANIIKLDAENYRKMTPLEHILARSDTYIGHIEPTREKMWICENSKIIKTDITFTPGFYKTADELKVNACDAAAKDPTVSQIKIEVNKEKGFISVYNNGDIGIPVEEHPEHKTLVPTMIFGELLTSSNYNDDEKRTTGGRNGYGAKLANIFSTEFIVEIGDAKRGKHYTQTWRDNMHIVEPAKITKLPAKTKSFVKVTYYPDFKRFNINCIDDDHFRLFHRRTIDIAGTANNKLSVFFNDEKINVTNFKQYIEMYYPDKEIYYDDNTDRWSVGCIYKPDSNSETVSFVNSISTYHGGTHCNHVIDNIIKTLINDYIKKKDKDIKISPTLLRENIIFFINSTIENPAFSSQTKDTLTTKIDKFGSKYTPSQAFMKKIAKCGIVEQVIELAKFKENSNLKKTDGKKQIRIIGIPKLDDANKAGTKDSSKCTLILTEGDSAKATAMSGLSVIGRDYYGIFPLKGKILNVRDATPSQLLANEEIKNIKIILGLKQGEDYTIDEKFNTLRYGSVLLLTDQDTDGFHIKGLFINMIHSLWPSLVINRNFIQTLNTPIVKAFKGKQTKVFYNLTDYDTWVKLLEARSWAIKYYKGLGTSTAIEARDYFTDINNKLIKYHWTKESKSNDDDKIENDKSLDSITLAFEKTRADDRKKWLMNYNKDAILKYENKNVTYDEFIHNELIHFSNDDLHRSIPSVIDGLKPSQRKILFGAFLRGLDKSEVKVAQLAGFVSDKAAYHHGEMSLNGAIVGMAQNFVGSNNINILKPNGQYGTRHKGGKDSASPRYIWTKLEDLTSIIYNQSDEPVLKHQYEDSELIEPEYYIPIIPMVLVNGAEGIGTGFSTKIPPYNPIDIIKNLKKLLKGKQMKPIDPWWKGFQGDITKIDEYNYEIRGNYTIKNNKLIITELPVGEWTSNYKEFLDKMLEESHNQVKPKGKAPEKEKKKIKETSLINYKDNNTDTKVHFELIFEDGYLDNADNIEKEFHLCKKFSITNMHLYGAEGHIKHYSSVNDIIQDYYKVRLELYQKRKDYQLELLEFQVKLISWKVKFILYIIENKLEINNKKRAVIEEKLIEFGFPKLGKNKDDEKVSYDYLLSLPVYNLTKEKIDELKKNKDDKETEFNELNDLSPEEIWSNELGILLEKYQSWSESS